MTDLDLVAGIAAADAEYEAAVARVLATQEERTLGFEPDPTCPYGWRRVYAPPTAFGRYPDLIHLHPDVVAAAVVRDERILALESAYYKAASAQYFVEDCVPDDEC